MKCHNSALTMTDLETRLQSITQALQAAAHKHGRPMPLLLAVSKKHPADTIEALYKWGQRAFGESYLQEALQKQLALAHLAIEWHFIGPIQSNKTREIANHFSWVHSIDRLKIARRLNDQLMTDKAPLNVCIQVNIDNERSKAGVTPEEVIPLCKEIIAMPNLALRGLMCIPQKRTEPEHQRIAFAALGRLLSNLKTAFATSHPEQASQLDTLSMGMSNDYEAAIAEGSTIVRIGTALFGER